MIEALGARVHLLTRPAHRERFTELFRDVLRCQVREVDFGLAHPLLLVAFSDGSAFSVEFTDAADDGACRTWIEFRARDVAAVQDALQNAGVSNFRHPGSAHTYFTAPGGQVFRVIDVEYHGP